MYKKSNSVSYNVKYNSKHNRATIHNIKYNRSTMYKQSNNVQFTEPLAGKLWCFDIV